MPGVAPGQLDPYLRRTVSRERDPSPTRGQFSSGWVPRTSMVPSESSTPSRPSGGSLKRRSVSADAEGLHARSASGEGTSSPSFARASMPEPFAKQRSLGRWMSLGRLSSIPAEVRDSAEDQHGRSASLDRQRAPAADPPLSGLTRFESLDFDEITPSVVPEAADAAADSLHPATSDEHGASDEQPSAHGNHEAAPEAKAQEAASPDSDAAAPHTDSVSPGAAA